MEIKIEYTGILLRHAPAYMNVYGWVAINSAAKLGQVKRRFFSVNYHIIHALLIWDTPNQVKLPHSFPDNKRGKYVEIVPTISGHILVLPRLTFLPQQTFCRLQKHTT
jgi:hypothetical protein